MADKREARRFPDVAKLPNMGIFRLFGQGMLMFLSYLGEMGGLARGIVESLIKGKLRWRLVGRQIVATALAPSSWSL
jgi:hypothetical protein